MRGCRVSVRLGLKLRAYCGVYTATLEDYGLNCYIGVARGFIRD